MKEEENQALPHICVANVRPNNLRSTTDDKVGRNFEYKRGRNAKIRKRLKKSKNKYKVISKSTDIYYRTQPDRKGIHRKNITIKENETLAEWIPKSGRKKYGSTTQSYSNEFKQNA